MLSSEHETCLSLFCLSETDIERDAVMRYLVEEPSDSAAWRRILDYTIFVFVNQTDFDKVGNIVEIYRYLPDFTAQIIPICTRLACLLIDIVAISTSQKPEMSDRIGVRSSVAHLA